MNKKISYGIGALGKDMVYALVSGFILYYYNTILGISGTFTGIMMMLARVFDAFNDPIMGVVVEKTNTKFGKFRPWIFSGTIINALILYGMFAMPESLSGTAMLIYASLAYVLWGVSYTMMDIPFWSMIPALTKPGKEREDLTVVGRTSASIGFAIPTAITMLLVTHLGSSERQGFAYLAAGIALVFILFETICILGIKEKPTKADKTPSLKEMLQSLVSNDQAMLVVLAIILFNSSIYLTSQLALYFFKYDIGNSEIFGLFGIIGGAGQMFSMMTYPILRKRWSTRQVLIGGIGVTIFGYLLLFLLASLHQTSIIFLGLSAFIIYIGFGLVTVLTTIFLADTVDYGEWKTGQRNESVVFSMQTFVVKLASAISVLISGIGIDLIGLDVKAAQQSPETLFGLRALMTIVPIIGFVVSLCYFTKKYKLTEAETKRIAQELASRRGAEAAHD
ncbi:melibiose permease [Streptococcus henryi]|uniref:Melibiose permease n=1 Tax=Streptococcus henryi TaxID=439219 RepID=A0A1G6A600_9STRE|nr:glycoside-pentoside-hexuronide (GPH):cation symporter [Streptococcus henryi]SDB03844.1 melibiose permease [Streptococcus henryi]